MFVLSVCISESVNVRRESNERCGVDVSVFVGCVDVDVNGSCVCVGVLVGRVDVDVSVGRVVVGARCVDGGVAVLGRLEAGCEVNS